MSIHGICFDEGQSGNCGLECRGFLDGECTIPDEIVEAFKDEVLEEYLGAFRLGVYRAQSNYPELERKELARILDEEYGY